MGNPDSIRYKVRPSTMEDVEALTGRLRFSDELEVGAATGMSADQGMCMSFDMSEKCWTGFADEKPVLIFGVVRPSMLSFNGSPWFLGTDEVDNVGLPIVRRSRHYIRKMLDGFALLQNYVDARHESSIRWLRWCGFKIEPAAPYGLLGLPFHRFWMLS